MKSKAETRPTNKLVLWITALVLLVTVPLAYGVITLVRWMNRPPFRNEFRIGETSSVFSGWRKYPRNFVASDGTHVLFDVHDNVILLARPHGHLQKGRSLRAHWKNGGAAVVGTGTVVFVPWKREQLVTIGGEGELRIQPLPNGTVSRLYAPRDPRCADRVVAELYR